MATIQAVEVMVTIHERRLIVADGWTLEASNPQGRKPVQLLIYRHNEDEPVGQRDVLVRIPTWSSVQFVECNKDEAEVIKEPLAPSVLGPDGRIIMTPTTPTKPAAKTEPASAKTEKGA